MYGRWTTLVGGIAILAGCAASGSSGGQAEGSAAASGGQTEAQASAAAPAMAGGTTTAAPHCTPSPRMPVAGRASPYDSVTVSLGGENALVCYGRPSVKGRTIFGGLLPYGKLWRTGANEPTIIHLPFAARIAGIAVEPGSYSLYTIPGESQWTVIVNRSTSQWGHESRYDAAVEAQEVGRAQVPAERTGAPVETFVIRSAPTGSAAADLVLEWENTRVRIPITRG